MKILLCVALSHRIPLFFLCSMQTFNLAVSYFSQSHRIQDDRAFYSYVFPIPMFLKLCVSRLIEGLVERIGWD